MRSNLPLFLSSSEIERWKISIF
uniref:Uncharacterized protein n=1 Tax=Vitis vinifera TaxID=29760 RepID=F6GWU5_VITVI